MKISDELSRVQYDQFEIERWAKSFWEENKIYQKIRERHAGSGKKFYFLDGPPYASARSIHPGTAWNKVTKDIVIRYYRMNGYDVWDKPGYDTHGLPIEVKIEQALGSKSKKDVVEKIGVERFINSCREFVDSNMEAMTHQFKEIGSSLDWERPYVTYENSYIEAGWWLIKRAHERGLLYRGKRVLHWCPRCETVLADYEVSEYKELEDPSIYVKFPVRGKKGEYLLIWTTTPWTLPANIFVMAHPNITYARVRVGDEVYILAKPRLEDVMKEAGIKSYEILELLEGSALEGLEYDHPLEDLVDVQREIRSYHKVVLTREGVTAHEGTGLVHAASGHGTIDYEVAVKEGIPIVSLVDEVGRMTKEAGKYAGMHFRDEANAAVIEDLKSKGYLLHAGKIVHRYPVCWRCKTPLALRATEQWFIAVTKLKDELIREAEKIEWVPDWAKTRFLNMLYEVRDWAISRQRFWGIPLPIWRCKQCDHYVVIGSLDELKQMGAEVPPDLHRPWVDRIKLPCPCGGEMERVPDVLDVWFDSGIAFYASLGYPRERELYERLKPVDFITEGHDQIRGWFFSLLRSGVIANGEAPYRRVLVHGFMLDEQGREMHKSLGNYVDFEELISKVPRDVIRLWLASNTVWEDLRFSWRSLEQTARDFTIVWNTYVFASTYMALDAFDPEKVKLEDVADALEPEDRWLLSRVNSLVRLYRDSMEGLKIHEAVRALRSFIVEDVSRFYLRLVRRRVWEERDTPNKRAAYFTIYYTLKTWLTLAAPIVPFLTEFIYQKLFRQAESGMPESVHMLRLPAADERLIDESLERRVAIVREMGEAALAARASAGLKLRRPVRRVVIAPRREDAREAVASLKELFAELVNAKEVTIESAAFFEGLRFYSLKPNLGEIGKDYKRLAPQIVKLIEERSAEIAHALSREGRYKALLNGSEVVLEARHVEVIASYPEWLVVKDSDYGLIAIDKNIGKEEEAEGLAREVIRRIQHMRKEARLAIEELIEVWLDGDEELIGAVRSLEGYVAQEVRAMRLNYGKLGGSHVREWEIDDKVVKIGISRVEASPNP